MHRRSRSLIGNISGPSKQCGSLNKGFGNGKQRPRLLLGDKVERMGQRWLLFRTEPNTFRFIKSHVLSEFVLFMKVFSFVSHHEQLSTTKAVVRPINELVSEFWLESRSDGMVDYVCFRLIDIAAQKSTGALVQRIWSCWDEFAHPIRVCDRFEVDGRLLLPAC